MKRKGLPCFPACDVEGDMLDTLRRVKAQPRPPPRPRPREHAAPGMPGTLRRL